MKAGDPEAARQDIDGLLAPELAAKLHAKREQKPPSFDVLPENWPAAKLFVDCSSQWAMAPSGRAIGLRYEAVDVVIRRAGHQLTPDDWSRFQVLERTAIKELNR